MIININSVVVLSNCLVRTVVITRLYIVCEIEQIKLLETVDRTVLILVSY